MEAAHWASKPAKNLVTPAPVLPDPADNAHSGSIVINPAAKVGDPYAAMKRDMAEGKLIQYSGAASNFPVKKR